MNSIYGTNIEITKFLLLGIRESRQTASFD
jgi:hypothetical protein